MAESLSASEAARRLRVSISTLKRMAADGTLPSFRTPGGHLRVPSDAVDHVYHTRQLAPTSAPTSVLQNKREAVEALTLEAQRLRAQRDLQKLQAEQAAEAEAARLQRQRAIEEAQLAREREAREGAERQQRIEAQRRQDAFHTRWRAKVVSTLPDWLTPVQRTEATTAAVAEIIKHDPDAEGYMPRILADLLGPLLASWDAQREQQTARTSAVERAVRWELSGDATPTEEGQAAEAARRAVAKLPADAKSWEIEAAANAAVAPIAAAAKRRQDAEWDDLRLSRLLRHGLAEIPRYLQHLYLDDEISSRDYRDLKLRRDLERAVRQALQDDLSGDDDYSEVEGIVREVIDAELDVDQADS